MLSIKNLRVNLEKKLLECDKTIIFPHKGPDFDAVASSLGMSIILQNLKRDNHIFIGDEKVNPGVQAIIEETKDEHSYIGLEEYQSTNHDNDLNILCDVNKPNLLLVDEKFPKEKLIIIDHHDKDSETLESSVEHIDSNASSASEIVTYLIDDYGIKISEKMANILLSGILLDTKQLTSKTTTRTTSKAVDILFNFGGTIRHAKEYFNADINSIKKNYIVGILIGSEDVTYTKEELAKGADYLSRYKVDAAYALGLTGDNVVSISARSKEAVNVGNVMRKLEGGGTEHAAATELQNTSLEEVGQRLRKIILPGHKNI